jgi:type VI secretion system protein ImpL
MWKKKRSMPKTAEQLPDGYTERAGQEIKILDFELKKLADSLLKKGKNFFYLPLYLIMGHSGFGKTTLLTKAGLSSFDFKARHSIYEMPSTQYCKWWHGEDAIYLDLAGNYTLGDRHNNLVFRNFLQTIKKRRPLVTVNGLVLIIDLPAVLKDQELLSQVVNDFNQRVYEVSAIVKKLPLFVVFTKLDLISGFSDFFKDLDVDHRKHAFGVALHEHSHDSPVDFSDELAKLIKRIQNKMFDKLHFGEALGNEVLHEFPLQFSSLRKILSKIINAIPKQAHIFLRGVYFTSSIQKGVPFDYVSKKVAADKNFAFSKKAQPLILNDTSYFVDDLFNSIIATSHKSWYLDLTWPKSLAIFSLAFLLFLAGWFGYTSYQRNSGAITIISQAISDFQEHPSLQKGDNFAALSKVIEKLDQINDPWWMKLSINPAWQLNKAAQSAFYDGLSQLLLPQIQRVLEKEVLSSMTSDPKKLYQTLKIYLMLGNVNPVEIDAVRKWFGEYLGIAIPDRDLKNQLEDVLVKVLVRGGRINAKKQIIEIARNNLLATNSALSEVVYSILKSKFPDKKFLLAYADQKMVIPVLFTDSEFSGFVKKVDGFVADNRFDDLVLGKAQKFKLSESESNALTNEVKKRYFEEYLFVWNNVLRMARLDLSRSSDLKTLPDFLKHLTTGEQSLLNLLEVIRANTASKKLPANISQPFIGINNVNLSELSRNIKNVAVYFKNITNGSNINRSAFVATALRFQNGTKDELGSFKQFANSLPNPLQGDFVRLSNQMWQILLNRAKEHINNIWTKTVFNQYKSELENRYPLFADANQEVSIHAFTDFFGPGGTMDSFFISYLKPFIDAKQVYWTWKEIDGTHLDISRTVLDTFIRAALIQKMFYAGGTPILQVRFILIPLALSPNSASFTLTLDGKVVTFDSAKRRVEHMIWPGPTPGEVSVEFINRQGSHSILTKHGDWAWFRILHRSNLKPLGDSQHLEVLMDLNGNAVRYELLPEQAVNPFLLTLLNDFRCLEKL